MKNPKRLTMPPPSKFNEKGKPLYAVDDLIAYWEITDEEIETFIKYGFFPTNGFQKRDGYLKNHSYLH